MRTQRTGEGSLHPQPEGRGIRDPPRSRCNQKSIFLVLLQIDENIKVSLAQS
jgi:hypothetical protein